MASGSLDRMTRQPLSVGEEATCAALNYKYNAGSDGFIVSYVGRIHTSEQPRVLGVREYGENFKSYISETAFQHNPQQYTAI